MKECQKCGKETMDMEYNICNECWKKIPREQHFNFGEGVEV